VDLTTALLAASAASVALAVVSAALVPALLARLPDDHFLLPPAPRRHPIARNLAGAVLVLAGVVMLFVPGQGVLTILAGLCLLDFPGRHAAILRILRQRTVQRAVTVLRGRRGQPPLRLPAE